MKTCQNMSCRSFSPLALALAALASLALAEAGAAPGVMPGAMHLRGGGVQRTLGILKPDVVLKGKVDQMKKIIEADGFKIVKEKKMCLTVAQAKDFYKEHAERPFYGSLVNFMTSGDCVVLILQKDDAIKGWRSLMGPTNSIKARAEAKDSLRAKFGTDGSQNACHGSDSPGSARREIRFFFGLGEWLQLLIAPLKLFWPK
ncbi:nucleoside diphosphate kinase [Baffinella frigidus]|nr:nucleoside diphosphate kinase [Cryptophyta sp. CCMP2293]